MKIKVVVHGNQPLGSGLTRAASIEIGGISVFTEFVFDNPKNNAEENIVRLFASRMRTLLESP